MGSIRSGGAVRLRVHLVPLGYDVARATTPAKVLRADAVILLIDRRDERTGSPLRLAKRRLRSHHIECEELVCDVWDPPTVVDEVGNIVTSAAGHDYYFNISTGPRTAGIGGTIASMFWPIRPYYQPVGYVDSSIVSKVNAPVTGPPIFIPTFEVPSLDPRAVETLRFLAEQSGSISKGFLMNQMKRADTIFPRQKAQVTPQAFHAQANVILRHLVGWGFVEIDGRGRGMRIRVTDMGRGGARMFGHVIHPTPVPGILQG